MERALAEYEIQTVFHLAAQTIVGIANRSPLSTFETNIKGTWCLLEAARRCGRTPQVVVASSDKAYGEQRVLPYTEDAPLEGRHPYDASKSCADILSLTYHHTYRLPVCVTRCGNFYGGGDLNWNRLVPGTIRSVLRGERPVIRSDGSFIRDYFYVKDGAAAYLHLAECMARDPEVCGHAFNFSTETPMTVLEMTHRILDQMGSPLEPDIRNEASQRDQEPIPIRREGEADAGLGAVLPRGRRLARNGGLVSRLPRAGTGSRPVAGRMIVGDSLPRVAGQSRSDWPTMGYGDPI